MGIKYEVTAVTGTYTDNNGNEKKRYTRMGAVLTTKNKGFVLKIEAIPVNWDGWAYLNDPEEKKEAPKRREPEETDSDIPFN